MSWTKKQIIEQAFSEIGIAPYVFDASAEQYQDALRMLDTMMALWDGTKGIRLRYPFSTYFSNSSLQEDSNIPDWALAAVYTNLAVNICSSYGKVASIELKSAATQSFKSLLSMVATPDQMQLPGTMPAGQGNKPWEFSNDPFLYSPSNLIDIGQDSTLTFNT